MKTLLRRLTSSTRSNRSHDNRRFRPRFQQLESRRLLAGPGEEAPNEGEDIQSAIVASSNPGQEVEEVDTTKKGSQDIQVAIEVRFITLNDNFFEQIGVDFDFDIDDNIDVILDAENENDANVVIGLDPTGNPTLDLDLSFVQDGFGSSVPSFGGFDAGAAANFGFAILSDIEVFFLLNAAQGNDRTNVMEAPKVTMFNGQSASISDGATQPFVTSIIPVVG